MLSIFETHVVPTVRRCHADVGRQVFGILEAERAPTARPGQISLHEVAKARARPPHNHAPAFNALELGYHLQAWKLPDGVQAQDEGTILRGEAFHPQLPD